MKEEIEKFRKEIKEYEDKLLEMGFHIDETKARQDWLYIGYKIKDEKYYINVGIQKDKINNKVVAIIMLSKPQEKFYYNKSLDEMLSILNTIFNN